VDFPIGIAPTAFVKLVHDDGEIGLAKGTPKYVPDFIHIILALEITKG